MKFHCCDSYQKNEFYLLKLEDGKILKVKTGSQLDYFLKNQLNEIFDIIVALSQPFVIR